MRWVSSYWVGEMTLPKKRYINMEVIQTIKGYTIIAACPHRQFYVNIFLWMILRVKHF